MLARAVYRSLLLIGRYVQQKVYCILLFYIMTPRFERVVSAKSVLWLTLLEPSTTCSLVLLFLVLHEVKKIDLFRCRQPEDLAIGFMLTELNGLDAYVT